MILKGQPCSGAGGPLMSMYHCILHMYECVCINTCKSVHLYICVYMCIYTYICVYVMYLMYTYTHITPPLSQT